MPRPFDIWKGEERIPFNIWDDYWDDGHIPAGDIQRTRGYIEEYDNITDDEKREIIQVVLAFLKTLDLTGVEVSDDDTQIGFKHLTHKRREKLMKELDRSGLQYQGVTIDFYSES